MLRRAHPGPPPGERVRALLPRPGGGWVPEPESGDALHAAGPGEARAAAPCAVVADAAPTELPDAGAGDGRRESVEGRWAALLPVAVRTGRLNPGRRGAVALVLAALLAAVVAGGVVLRGRPQEVAVPAVVSSGAALPGVSADPAPAAGDQLVVSVAGKVTRPGVVRLPPGSRVDDAVRAAGGPLPGASTGLLNLARRLIDGEQVLVGVDPTPGVPAAGAAGPRGGSAGGLLDLNTAMVSDLDALPGIGPVLAQRIVDWRTEHERFASVDQLREVTGIGEAKFEDLRGAVTV